MTRRTISPRRLLQGAAGAAAGLAAAARVRAQAGPLVLGVRTPLTEIHELRVYPPLGIARVGNAEGREDYVIGPEVIGGAPTLPNGAPARYVDDFRTKEGHIKRQAARFRVYAHMKDGTIAEVTADIARIEWEVAVANLKAGWYEFNEAMDLPRGLGHNAARRNANIPIPGGRATLDIVPTPKRIEGRNAAAVAFDDGTFWRKPVYLGELRTDSEGRLLFLGGRGLSEPFRQGLSPLTFANNVGWHDDVADGPVRATVTFPGAKPMEAKPGYVAVTPPNFAPGLFGLITMDDVVREVFQSKQFKNPLKAPTTTSFTRDIWPIFDHLTGLQWINHGLFVVHGFGSPLDARNSATVDRLRDGSPSNTKWRRSVFLLFRDPNAGGNLDEPKLQQVYGDGFDTLYSPPADATALLAVTPTQYAHLQRWEAGHFVDDWLGAVPVPPDFASLAPADQVAHLERAALHDCLGGPFHPGIEITWVIRIPLLWEYPYRLKVLPTNDPARQDYGDTLTPAVCVGPGGPFDGVAAGALTRFLGVPWQTDGASCNSASDYFPTTFLSMPTFWGARVPDQVLAAENYRRAAALDPERSATQTQKHLMLRVDWLRDIRGKGYFDRIATMVSEWWELGMVLPVAHQPAHLPADLRVEQGRNPRAPGSDTKPSLVAAVEELAKPVAVAAAPSSAVAASAAPSSAVEALARAAAVSFTPPKRYFRQGEI